MPSLTPASSVPAHDELLEDLLQSRALRILLDRAPRLRLRDWWVAGPALARTVWNLQDCLPAGLRIDAYEVVYHDPSDLTYAAEDTVAERVRVLAPELGARVVARNAARAHLRLEEELGVVTRPFGGSRHLISSYALTSSCVGVTHDGRGGLRVHAPHGLTDLYERRARPNPLVGRHETGAAARTA